MKQKRFMHGQSMIEFALIIPMVLFLLLGFLDLGRAFFYQSSLSNAVREGTRSGIVMDYQDNAHETRDALKKNVLESAFGLTNTNTPLTVDDITIIFPDDNDGIEDTLIIQAIFCFEPVTPGIALLINNQCDNGVQGFELTAKSIMRFEPGFN